MGILDYSHGKARWWRYRGVEGFSANFREDISVARSTSVATTIHFSTQGPGLVECMANLALLVYNA
jgi:hypothetical protein